MSNYGQIAVTEALKEVGVFEQPANSNYGPRVADYERLTGAVRQPWCASFVMFCLDEAGYDVDIFNRSAYVPYIKQRAIDLGLTVPVAHIQSGDLICFDWQGDGTPDHIGFATSGAPSGQFTTVEGNTAYGNDSNGGEVMQRTRSTHDVSCVIRLPEKPATVKPKPAKPWPTPIPAWFWAWATWKLQGSKKGKRPKAAPKLIPAWAWRRYAALLADRKKAAKK